MITDSGTSRDAADGRNLNPDSQKTVPAARRQAGPIWSTDARRACQLVSTARWRAISPVRVMTTALRARLRVLAAAFPRYGISYCMSY